MRARHLTVVATMLALAACSTPAELAPLPGAMPAPSGGAMAMDAGVRLEAEPGAWRGLPANLDEEVTPVLVHVTNESDRPLRLRYNDFVLRSPTGVVYRALPPFNIREEVSASVDDVPYNGFMVAPYLSPYYPGVRAYRDPFLYDELYYNRYYPSIVRIRLPTGDMIQQALPEGVLAPGGRISGFLYFEEVDDDIGQVNLTHALVTPDGENFGEIEIPFMVD